MSHQSFATRRYVALVTVTMSVVASLAIVVSSGRPAGAAELFAARRIVDTRDGQPTIDGRLSGGGIRPTASTLEIPVAGRAGVAAGAASVALNVTVDGATEPGFVTIFPCGATRPVTSNLNYVAGQTIAALAIARIGTGGAVCAFTSGSTHLVVDVTASFASSEFLALDAPRRLADTRAGQPTADGQLAGGGARPAESVLEVPVAGRVGTPANAGTVFLTVTVTNPAAAGHLRVYPCGVDRPVASNVNYVAGQTIANAVVARVGSNGSICVYTQNAADIVVDIAGRFAAGVVNALTAPARVLDTRNGEPTLDGRFAGLGQRPAHSTLQLPVGGRAGIPANAAAVIVNVTAVGAGAGFVTMHPAGNDRPLASNLNYVSGQIVANAAIARLGTNGELCVHASANAHLIIDVVGWITGSAPPAAGDCPQQQLFPNWRIVAMYGNDSAPGLGVLGEQPPEQAAARVEQYAAPFRAGDRPVLGAFEYIATVANASPGPSGLFRAPSSDAQVQRYLDAARAHGLYLILDIQPGIADFFSEARRYEKFLRQPDVGLALDPEWHVQPGQTPGRVVGQVSAADINEIADWLAGLVAQENLPEKLMVVHQFQVRMITQRDTLRDRAGVALTIHMDGFGTRGEKLTTYSFVHTAPPLHNGFKLFVRQDINIFSPGEVLGLSPVPDLITYQ